MKQRSPLKLLSSLCLLLLLASANVPAEDSPEVAALKTFFTVETVPADMFAQSFLDQVPAAQLTPVRDQLASNLGAFKGVEKDGTNYRAIYEKGHIPTSISLDDEGKIQGLFLRPPVIDNSSMEESVGALQELEGELSIYVTRNGEVELDLNGSQAMPVGSAFKLSVLAALIAEIEAGERQWSQAHTLEARDRSLPSGTLQNWPVGAQLTLYSLAARMISESDNTATDALIHTLGRAAVEQQAPERNRPFLTTREAFILKNPDNAETLAAFREADKDERTEILRMAATLPPVAPEAFAKGAPMAIDIEWFYTGPEICALMTRVAPVDVTHINHGGLPSAGDWARVSFKGGSEPGVMNLTYGLKGKDGSEWCVTASTRDDKAIAAGAFVSRVHALIGSLVPG